MTLWNAEGLKPIGYLVCSLCSLKVRNPFLTLTWPGDLTFGDLGLKFLHKVSHSIVSRCWKNGGAARRRFSDIREKPEGWAFFATPSSARVNSLGVLKISQQSSIIHHLNLYWRYRTGFLPPKHTRAAILMTSSKNLYSENMAIGRLFCRDRQPRCHAICWSVTYYSLNHSLGLVQAMVQIRDSVLKETSHLRDFIIDSWKGVFALENQ